MEYRYRLTRQVALHVTGGEVHPSGKGRVGQRFGSPERRRSKVSRRYRRPMCFPIVMCSIPRQCSKTCSSVTGRAEMIEISSRISNLLESKHCCRDQRCTRFLFCTFIGVENEPERSEPSDWTVPMLLRTSKHTR